MQYRYGDTDVYALPGGNPDPGEDLEATLHRELLEELGVEIRVSKLLFCGVVVARASRKEDVLHCIFLGEIVGGDPELNPLHTTAQSLVWKPVGELVHLAMYPSVAIAIQEHSAATLPANTYLGHIDQPYFG